ncbi:MAG: TetR/AcrR family transcriptional regulator, partial [Eisenbergiella massiliensis]|uniref:TetR/AcrR family transcriptional regulator n=1 Tax=Eisenbergiella massiliensis TaxID=1720294 RepID=UPI0023F1DA5D
MRITKEPEERKQEILDTAMRLFYEKGYEKTSIADIAKEIGVAQGLCYRYFPSKEALFDSAIEQYADEIANKFTISKSNEKLTLKEIIETMPIMVETEGTDYYNALHVVENKKFH